MVSLSRIYTRTGDAGTTRLGDNAEVSKIDVRVEAYGSVDELNATLGLATTQSELPIEYRQLLRDIQNDLFDLGADLCLPERETKAGEREPLRITATQVQVLEREIDRCNERLEPLRSFILPGGHELAALLHLARAVCRRAERRCWSLVEAERVNEQALIYLNRLSDLLFVLARMVNDGGAADVLWQPGGSVPSEDQ